MTKKDPFQLTPLRVSGRPCRFLRTQGAFQLGSTEYDETTRFWCVRSLDTCGPDGSAAHMAWCQAGRVCYEAPPLVV
jgi:hypothetical protein